VGEFLKVCAGAVDFETGKYLLILSMNLGSTGHSKIAAIWNYSNPQGSRGRRMSSWAEMSNARDALMSRIPEIGALIFAGRL
jgi:hypothetical protein